MPKDWTPSSWKNFKALQQPDWPIKKNLFDVLGKLKELPSLVFSGETRNLKDQLIKVSEGSAFILQAGNCAESFSECNGPEIHNYMRIMWAMTDIIQNKSGKQVIKIGRIAGQYAKPRSSNYEYINGNKIPVYRGDNINSPETSNAARKPDPNRLLEGYYRSAATLNLIRAFELGNYGGDNYRSDWFEFPYSEDIKNSKVYERYNEGISKINFKDLDNRKGFYISHEALVLDYEEAFTRIDTTFGGHYNTSAHFLWVGDRTRDINSAHIEYLSGIGNPLGIKIGPDYSETEIIGLIKRINPENAFGKVVLIIRFGKENISNKLPFLIESVKAHALNVIWMSDPMHGNTYSLNGRKVRNFDDILAEVECFFNICKEMSVVPGGMHLEITSKLVTECLGGLHGVSTTDLQTNYESKVDPRLNGAQAFELAMKISQLI